MNSKRQSCKLCSNEALLKTLERNQGNCEICAKKLADQKSKIELTPRIATVIQITSFLLPLLIATYVFYRCHTPDWHIVWNVVWAVFVFLFSFQGTGYFLGTIATLMVKSKVGLKK